MVRVCSVAFAVLVAAVMSASPRAQGRPEAQTPPAGEVRIIATGSFLGQFDGFVTNPGHSRDTNAGTGFRPYGGLLGVIDFLHARWGQATPPAGELLLIAGDNASHGFAGLIRGEHSSSFGPSKRFWTELAKLQPAAVALWSEDFYRALAPPSREADSNAGRFANFIARREIPFLASNAAIRLHKTRLNTIENAGIELEIDRDRSLAWVDKLSLRFDCDREDLTYTLRAGAASIASNALTSTGDDDPCLDVDIGLMLTEGDGHHGRGPPPPLPLEGKRRLPRCGLGVQPVRHVSSPRPSPARRIGAAHAGMPPGAHTRCRSATGLPRSGGGRPLRISRRHGLHLIHDELDRTRLLVRRVAVPDEQPLDRRAQLRPHVP